LKKWWDAPTEYFHPDQFVDTLKNGNDDFGPFRGRIKGNTLGSKYNLNLLRFSQLLAGANRGVQRSVNIPKGMGLSQITSMKDSQQTQGNTLAGIGISGSPILSNSPNYVAGTSTLVTSASPTGILR
jgi:hypothetical protein